MNTQDNQHYWQQQISAWQTSTLSGAAYCKAQGLTYHRFSYWRKKLMPNPRPETPSGFARVVPTPGPKLIGELTVSLPGGIAITGLHAGNVDLLGSILKQL